MQTEHAKTKGLKQSEKIHFYLVNNQQYFLIWEMLSFLMRSPRRVFAVRLRKQRGGETVEWLARATSAANCEQMSLGPEPCQMCLYGAWQGPRRKIKGATLCHWFALKRTTRFHVFDMNQQGTTTHNILLKELLNYFVLITLLIDGTLVHFEGYLLVYLLKSEENTYLTM